MIGGYAMHGHAKEALKHLNGCMKKVYSQIMPLLLVFCQSLLPCRFGGQRPAL